VLLAERDDRLGLSAPTPTNAWSSAAASAWLMLIAWARSGSTAPHNDMKIREQDNIERRTAFTTASMEQLTIEAGSLGGIGHSCSR